MLLMTKILPMIEVLIIKMVIMTAISKARMKIRKAEGSPVDMVVWIDNQNQIEIANITILVIGNSNFSRTRALLGIDHRRS